MKVKALFLSAVLVATALTGCAKDAPAPEPPAGTTAGAPVTPETTGNGVVDTTTQQATDVITTASIVDNEAAFEKAIQKDGTWIIATLKDLTFDKELVLEGDFTNNKDEVQRKIALYTQDENRTVTNRFTLTAPKLTIKSPKASIQHGIFKGDLYVETTDFSLVDTKVDGNIYFASEEAQKGFQMDTESSVSGKQEVKK